VIDGTGSPAVNANIAVENDLITAVAPDLNIDAEQVIDARGAVASPGFIDMHSHGGAGIIERTTADSKAHDGVTTEVLGNCGSSPFPTDKFPSADAFFGLVDEVGTSINRAFLAGLGSIRAAVMGSGAEPASPEQIRTMRDTLAGCIEEGAFGVSTGLIYPPGCFTTREEMAEIAKAAGDAGALYATHMRDEGDEIEDAIDEAAFIAKASGARLHISHVKLSGKRNWHKIDWLEERLRGLIDSGIDLACDRYPYTASATDLGVLLPNWAHDGAAQQRMERLGDADARGRIESEILGDHPEPEYWDTALISAVPEGEDTAYNGKTLAEVAAMRDERPVETIMNLLARRESMPAIVIFSMCEENLRRVLSWPFVAAGSDARARIASEKFGTDKPHPRSYGTFARFLGRYVREENVLALEEAVRRITSLPAERLGLRDRGVIRAGALADITIFDPDTIADRATYHEPHQPSAGILHVIVNGQPVIENGSHNGALPGRILRRSG
jgi:N-acyl-D-amino-acid deacylase